MRHKIKVIALDLDGVIYDGPSAVYPVAKALGIEKEFLEALVKVREKRASFREGIVEGSKIWMGVPVDRTLDSIIEHIPLMSGAEESILQLKAWGYEVGIISSGVSQFYLRPLTQRLQLDFAYSNILGETDGAHDGTVLHVMDGPAKAQAAATHLGNRGYSQENLASVGDGENDIDMFGISAFSIAFNPTSKAVSEAATLTINSKDLRDILLHFKPE